MRRLLVTLTLALMIAVSSLGITGSLTPRGADAAYIVRATNTFCLGYTSYSRWGTGVNAVYYLVWSDGYQQPVYTYAYYCPA